MVPSLTPYNFPLSPIGGPKCTAQDQLRDACCHLANIIEDIDKLCAVPDIIMSRVMSPFGKILWPLFCLVNNDEDKY